MSSTPALNQLFLDGLPPQIILLHGWGQNLQALTPLGTLLHAQTGHSVRLIDLPGFGASDDPPPEGWNTLQYAERIVAYLDEKGIDRAVFIGHSFGGRIVLQLASKFAGRVEAVVLIDAAGLPPIRNFRQKRRYYSARALGLLMSLLPEPMQQPLRAYRDKHFASEDYLKAGSLRPTLVKTVTEDLTAEAASIKAPALLVWGELDSAVPVSMARRLAELIAGSQLTVLEHRDHFPFLPSPDLCAYHIARFLSSLPSFNKAEVHGK